MELCERCKNREAHHEHHKDGNHKNNNQENIQYLCTLCHAELHGSSPKQSELKRFVIMRDRAIRIRNALNNQIRGFSRIEYITPEIWENESKEIDKIIKNLEKEIKKLLKSGQYPIWNWLKEIRGISFISASKLISYIDIKNTPTISALWRYCGLDATHIKRTNKISKEEAMKFGNPYLKKELLGILAKNGFIMHNTPLYREIYDKEKEKQLEIEYPEGFLKEKYNGYKITDKHLSKGHAHNRAIRKMIKIFLEHLWREWRTLENLSITEPYIIGRNGHSNYIEATDNLKTMSVMRARGNLKPTMRMRNYE